MQPISIHTFTHTIRSYTLIAHYQKKRIQYLVLFDVIPCVE